MRRCDSITPIYSIGFVCEGEKTEPFFVDALHNKVKSSLRHVVSIIIHPTPVPVSTTTGQTSKRRRDVTKTPKTPTPDPLVVKYKSLPMPENWVRAGEELLDTCNEVWVLFDKDGHPNMKQAFALAAHLRKQNKRFNIVFSSRCFEHYMLLHYELNHSAFNKSECNRKINGKTVYGDCQLPNAKAWGCNGTFCINGYARKNGYWQESKNKDAFEKCRNLWWGILNAFHVKWQSICNEPVTKAIYDRNPYLNIYQMTLRMMEMISLEPFAEVRLNKGNGQYNQLSRAGDLLHFECQSVFPLKEIKISIYELPSITELNTVPHEQMQLLEKQPVEQTYSLGLTQGNAIDIDITSFLTTPQHYAKLEWGGIIYFVAPLQSQIPAMTQAQVESLKVISVSEEMINAI